MVQVHLIIVMRNWAIRFAQNVNQVKINISILAIKLIIGFIKTIAHTYPIAKIVFISIPWMRQAQQDIESNVIIALFSTKEIVKRFHVQNTN